MVPRKSFDLICVLIWLPPEAPNVSVTLDDAKAEVTRRLQARPEPEGVRPACEPLDGPPGGVGLHRMLVELARRGDVQYEADLNVPLQRRRVVLSAARLVAAQMA